MLLPGHSVFKFGKHVLTGMDDASWFDVVGLKWVGMARSDGGRSIQR